MATMKIQDYGEQTIKSGKVEIRRDGFISDQNFEDQSSLERGLAG